MSQWSKKGPEKVGDKACATIDTLIGPRADVTGDFVFSGGLRIDGRVKGNIRSSGDTTSLLVLSEQAMVTGDIDVAHIVINGTVKGNVRAAEHIELQEKAEIQGDLTYKSLQMALGARLNGKLIHTADVKTDANRPAEPFKKKPSEGLAV